MMSPTPPRFLLAVALALAVVLTGCGGSNKKGGGYSYLPASPPMHVAV